jgi:hypothetical protein
MSQSLVKLAKELTLALIETGNVAPDDMQETLQKTDATLSAFKEQEAPGATTRTE